LYVNVNDDGKLKLNVNQNDLDDNWNENVRFAVRPRNSLQTPPIWEEFRLLVVFSTRRASFLIRIKADLWPQTFYYLKL